MGYDLIATPPPPPPFEQHSSGAVSYVPNFASGEVGQSANSPRAVIQIRPLYLLGDQG